MISAIEWVPAGVADPNPKKYEFSQAELELIKMMEEQKIDEDAADNVDEMPSDNVKKIATELPVVNGNLPADLRMDEYSSDDDENDAVQGTAVGNLLVEDADDEEFVGDAEERGDSEDDQDKSKDAAMDANDSEDSDDDLGDVPDTREYTPLDVDGFTSLGLSHVGTNAPTYMEMHGNGEEEDDGSEAEDVQIQADDALVVVAKTEDVSLLL